MITKSIIYIAALMVFIFMTTPSTHADAIDDVTGVSREIASLEKYPEQKVSKPDHLVAFTTAGYEETHAFGPGSKRKHAE